MKELINIQSRLVAPKGQFNAAGKYKYRNCEDILKALKPLLCENGCFLTIVDDIVVIQDRFYVKATATITKDNKSISSVAYARETEASKFIADVSQITGSTSSYARKYALNGLFLLDDTKDADNYKGSSAKQAQELELLFKEAGVSKSKLLQHFGVKDTKDLNYNEVKELIELNEANKKAKQEDTFKKVNINDV